VIPGSSYVCSFAEHVGPGDTIDQVLVGNIDGAITSHSNTTTVTMSDNEHHPITVSTVVTFDIAPPPTDPTAPTTEPGTDPSTTTTEPTTSTTEPTEATATTAPPSIPPPTVSGAGTIGVSPAAAVPPTTMIDFVVALPSTGASPAMPLLVGAGLIAVGLTLARRRERRPSNS
jgi:LPXTG-motif cell wall-anchored protein